MLHRGIKRLSIALFISTLSLLSNTVYALQDGVYSGTVAMDLQCSSPTAGPVNFSATMVASISAGSATLVVADAAGDFAYSGSGSVGTTFINTSGAALVNTGNTGLDGTYSPATFNLVITDNGTSITVQPGSFGSASVGGITCASISYGLTSTATLNFIAQGAINPEETPSNQATDPIVLIAGLRQDVNTFSNRSNAVMRGNGNGFQRNNGYGMTYGVSGGLNAGDGQPLYGAWVSYSYTDFDYEFAPLAFDGARHSVLGGVDFSPWENSVLGIAFGYENSDIDTTFNRGKQDTDGYTIASYFGVLLSDTFSIDATVGYSRVDTDQFRTTGVATRVTSSPETDRYFGAMNLNGVWFVDNWVFGARTGLLFARSDQDAFTESDTTAVAAASTKLNQWNVGADAAYSFGEWEPFGRVSYENDFSQTQVALIGATQPKNDDDSLVMGVGVRWFGAAGLTGNFEMTRRLGKADFDESSLNITIRGEF